MIKMDRNFSNFHLFLGYTPPKCLSSRTNELKLFGRLESTHFQETHVLGAIYHRILQQLRMVFLYLLLGPWHWLPGQTNGMRGVEKLHSIQLHRRDHSRVDTAIVHGRLKTLKVAKIETLTLSPPALKKILGKTNHVGVFGGSRWTFSHREIQINKTFFICCLV